MSDQSKYSTLLDEYSGDAQTNGVLDEVLGDVNLQYRLQRYQIIGEVIRHELPEQFNTEFSTGVMSQIKQIDTSTSAANRFTSAESIRSIWTWPFLKPVAGLAVAASVALVSVTFWQSNNAGSQLGQVTNKLVNVDRQKIDQRTGQPVPLEAVTVASKINDGMRWTLIGDAPALQQKLNAYLVNHTEYSNSLQGLIPQARVAGYDTRQ